MAIDGGYGSIFIRSCQIGVSVAVTVIDEGGGYHHLSELINLEEKTVDLKTKMVDLKTKVVDLNTKILDLKMKIVDL